MGPALRLHLAWVGTEPLTPHLFSASRAEQSCGGFSLNCFQECCCLGFILVHVKLQLRAFQGGFRMIIFLLQMGRKCLMSPLDSEDRVGMKEGPLLLRISGLHTESST